MTDQELEDACQRVLQDDSNRFEVILCRRGNVGVYRLAEKVMNRIPKSELTRVTLDRSEQILTRLLSSTT